MLWRDALRQSLIAAALMTASLPFAAMAPVHAKSYATTPVARPSAEILKAVADPRRKPENVKRDVYRHPAETLAFFGVRPDQTVVEVFPSGGWYAEILAPLLKDKGRYIAAAQPPGKYRTTTEDLFASDPARFGKAQLTTLDPKAGSDIAPAGSADVVLTFRNVHNLIMGGEDNAKAAFASFFRALKPGGVLGVVDHRLPEDRDVALEKTSGYLKTSTVIRLAQQAGFRLAGQSEINANPKDKADYPTGVWTLPPVLRNGDVDRAKYVAIGESDRMTLKFVKP